MVQTFANISRFSLLPKQLQIVLFSATFPDQVKEFAARFAPNANSLTLKQEELTVDGIKQMYMDCTGEQHKYEVLVRLYGLMTIGSSIIFVKVCTHTRLVLLFSAVLGWMKLTCGCQKKIEKGYCC